jgi:hypothetical protein
MVLTPLPSLPRFHWADLAEADGNTVRTRPQVRRCGWDIVSGACPILTNGQAPERFEGHAEGTTDPRRTRH